MFLIENNIYDKKLVKPYEALMSIGNGYLTIRSSFEFDVEFNKQDDLYMRFPDNVTLEKPRNVYGKWGTFISGVVGQHPLLNEEMVNLPYFLGFNIYDKDKKVDILNNVKSFSQKLNIKNAIYEYELVFLHEDEEIKIFSKRVCDRANLNYTYQEILLETTSNKTFVLESFIDASVTTNGYNHFVERKLDFKENIKYVMVKTDLGSRIDILQKDISSGKFLESRQNDNRNSIFYEFNKSVSLVKNTFVKTNRDNILEQIKDYTFDLVAHEKLWNDCWEVSDVSIEGDEKLQKYTRYAIYHLIRSKKIGDEFVAIDAKGVCGEAYFGHYFWDTEIYLLPFFLYTNPQQAKELLMFRYNTLESAIENAKSYGYKGAKFPWESSLSGKEQCSNWQYKDFEIHISFDIVYAMYQYYKLTNDKDTMKEKFIKVMIEICGFICSRGSFGKDGKYHLKGVMGPDEYLAFTDDNAFTNYMAKFALEKTIELLKEFNLECSQLAIFEDTASKFYLPIDDDKKLIWQCEGFDNFEEIDYDKIWLNKNEPFGRFISQERNYRTKALKQGDVTCLHYLFEDDFDKDYLKNAMDYYLPITTHDSSLSYIIHSVLFSRLDNMEEAYEYFMKASSIDFEKLDCGEGIHIANCGGIYQSVIYGFAGLKSPMFSEKLEFKPKLPRSVTEIKFKINFQNKLYGITVKADCVEIKEI